MADSISQIAGLGLKEQMALAWANHRHISNNIANANTPNFQATRIRMSQQDQDALLELYSSNPSHLVTPDESVAPTLSVEAVENFSLDLEMGEMAKNTLFYQTLAETVMRRNQMAKSVLGGQ